MREQIQNAVQAMIKPLRNRVYNIVSRAVLEAVNDSGKMQVIKVSVLAGENRDDVEYFQDYGFTSVSKAGAEALILCPQGNREHMIAIKVGDRTVRIKGLASGDVAMFDDVGNKIHLKQNGTIEIVAATKVLVTSPEAEFSGNVKVKGNLTVEGKETVTGDATAGNVISNGAVTAASGAISGLTVGTPGTDLDDLKDIYNTHTHDENGDGGGTTDGPNETV